MKTSAAIFLLILTGCSEFNAGADFERPGLPEEIIIAANQNEESSNNDSSFHKDSFPIHGPLDQKQIDTYYRNILDTIIDQREIFAEPIDLDMDEYHVTMLHNAGVFDQMFLCTHDMKLERRDKYYIGKATMFDNTSHTIEYRVIGDSILEFDHVDWGWVDKNDEQEIDTIDHLRYTLTITRTGLIRME